MARKPGAKIDQCVRLLYGMRLPAVAAALGPYGWSPAVREDAWNRLRPLLTGAPPDALSEQLESALAELERFAATWLPVGRSALGSEHPERAVELFAGLDRDDPAASALSVATLLERLDQQGPEVRSLLEARGLGPAQLERARELLAELRCVSNSAAELAAFEEQQRRALEPVWAWYLEWSQIARVAIKNKSLLFALGLRARDAA
jgi:hypothetical protein